MLLGREREERLLDGLLDEARAGGSAVLAVVGEVGMGKSALLDEAARRATGMDVLRARGIQSEARIPFAALFELLRPALAHLDQVPAPQREALEGALALRPARAQDRFAVGAATLALLAASADARPLLVLVDDAHWLDGSTADALLFAVRRLVADPIAVVLAVREEEQSLLDGADLPTHRLEGLDRIAAGELVAQGLRGGTVLSEDSLDRLHRGTGGNPLALLELEDAAVIPASPGVDLPVPVGTRVAQVYRERCAALSGASADALLLAAATDVGDLSVLAKAAAALGIDVAALGAAEGRGLVTLSADRVEFRHPLVRSAVYADATAERRRAVHRALADALPDADADRRAWHLALATLGPDDAASSALEQAGRRARARSAYDVASQAFERAGALDPHDARRATLLHAAADAAWLAGLAERTVQLLDEARRFAPSTELLVATEHLRGSVAARLGTVGDAQRILLEGATLATEVDPDRAVVMLAEAVNAGFYAADATAMREAAARIPPAVPPDPGVRTAFFAAIAQGMAAVFGGDPDGTGAAFLRRAVELVETSDELSDEPRLLAWAAMGPLWLREAGTGSSLLARALDVARWRSAVGVLPFLLSHVGIEGVAGDRWPEAEAAFTEAIRLGRETGQRADLGFALARLAVLEARTGREQLCRTHVAEARALAAELDLGLAEIWSLAALGGLELGRGRAEEALAHFEAERGALDERGVADPDLSPDPELVELHLRLGRSDDAATCLERFADAAAAKGQPWALARAARCRGLLGGDDEIDRHFGDALAHHARTPDAFEAARTRLAYGGRLRRARQRTLAREHLRVAVDTFDRLGAAPWSDAARAELAATGETARRRALSTRDDLTPQELQVALLLADGRTTREAAATLFLSPKTVEYHLRNVYRKLSISSREELTRALASGTRNPT